MNRLWKTRLMALFMVLALTAGMVPAALAANAGWTITDETHENGETLREPHQWSDWIIDPDDSSKHVRSCKVGCGAAQSGSHASSAIFESNQTYHWKVCSLCGAEMTTRSMHAMEQKSDADSHWNQCKECGYNANKGGHLDADKNGACDTCGHKVAVNYTVTFQTLNSNIKTPYATQTVAAGSAPSNPATPKNFVSDGRTFVFKGWTADYNNGGWYLYTNQTLVDPASVAINGDTKYYAVYTEMDTKKITYTVAPGSEVEFKASDFNKAYQSGAGSSRSIRWVNFSVSRDYDRFGGQIYSGSTAFERSDLNNTDFYYEDKIYGKYELDSLTFQADGSVKDGDKLTITYYAYCRDTDYVEGTVEIVVDGETAGDIVYSVAPGEEIDIKASDFNRAYQQATSSRNSIQWVVFDVPNSYTSFGGTIYSGSKALTRTDLNNRDFYYSDKSYGDYDLDDLTFRADKNAKDGARLRITYHAYRDSDSVTGTMEIVIDEDGGGDIVYPVVANKTVDFKASDFNNFYRKRYSGSTLSYVEFDRPASDAFTDGTLYADYGTRSETSFTRSSLGSASFYYSNAKDGDYGLGDLTFVAGKNFQKTVSLNFTAYGSNGQSVRGTVVIRPSTSSSDITYPVAAGKTVELKRTDFNAFFRKTYKDTLRYVVFDRPASDAFNDGTLYYDYNGRDETAFTRTSLSGVKFCYSEADVGRKDYYLDDLTFAAGSGFKEEVILSFTAYGENEDDYVEGTVTFQPDAAAAVVTSSYAGNIRYSATIGMNVQINANDLARYYARNYPNQRLQYVVITGIPNAGALYYNYYGASTYGTASRAVLTSSNCAGQAFYLSPANTSQYALTELTYVPNGANYCTTIPFTAYGTGAPLSGHILISVNSSAVSEVYGVTQRNVAVNFPATAIYTAVQSATGTALSSIQLLSLPAASVGTVYVGAGTALLADTSTAYGFASGTYQMSQLRFVPFAGYTGSVEIPYVALNANGAAIASGVFSLGVVSSEKKFTDVTNSTWCYKYVAELSDANVISGYSDGGFKPDSTVTYGAALKLIMLAAGYPEQAPTTSNVFSGYLAKARTEGIVTRSDVDLSAPITRLQMAQLAAGALKLDTGSLSSVKPFTDTSDVYVQALNAAGIVEGYFANGTSTFRSNGTLTRGQIAAIVWRMNQYRK